MYIYPILKKNANDFTYLYIYYIFNSQPALYYKLMYRKALYRRRGSNVEFFCE